MVKNRVFILGNMDLYQEIILEHFKHPLNRGSFADTKNVKVAKKINVSCGDEVTIQVQFSDDKKKIKDIRWQGVGCAISTAAMSLLSENLKGKSVAEVLAMKQADILELLGLDSITPGREKCLLLGLKAIKSAITDSDEAALAC